MARVLIVEDEEDLAELYRIELESYGHEILGIHADAESALENPRHPDVIVLDERLGWESGMAYFDDFRSAHPKARILLATADVEALEEAAKRDVDAVLKKPFFMAELTETVERLSARN